MDVVDDVVRDIFLVLFHRTFNIRTFNIEHGILNFFFFSLKKKMSGDAGESNLP